MVTDVDNEELARQRRRYFILLKGGGLVFLAVQVAVLYALGLPPTQADGDALRVLGWLFACSGLVTGITYCVVGYEQSGKNPLATRWRFTPYDLPVSGKVPHSFFLIPVAGTIAVLLMGAAAGYAICLPWLARWKGLVLVLPSVVWIASSSTYVLVVSLRLFHRRVRLAVESEQAARESLARAELTALRAQINPHFLFNALNTVADLIVAEPERAERTVERLAAVFRHTLARSPAAFTEVGEEVEFVRAYLGVERERFEERVSVEWDVDAEGLLLPTMILQPLVENALKHAIAPRQQGGTIRVTLHKDGTKLFVEVRDFGGPTPERSLADMLGRGSGLSNVNDRLIRLFGEGSGLRLEKPEGGGQRSASRVRP